MCASTREKVAIHPTLRTKQERNGGLLVYLLFPCLFTGLLLCLLWMDAFLDSYNSVWRLRSRCRQEAFLEVPPAVSMWSDGFVSQSQSLSQVGGEWRLACDCYLRYSYSWLCFLRHPNDNRQSKKPTKREREREREGPRRRRRRRKN